MALDIPWLSSKTKFQTSLSFSSIQNSKRNLVHYWNENTTNLIKLKEKVDMIKKINETRLNFLVTRIS